MFELKIDRKATKFVKKQDKITQKRIKNTIMKLAENPYNNRLNISKLTGYINHYRARVGDVRIIYEIKDKELIIHIFDIDNRGQIYNKW